MKNVFTYYNNLKPLKKKKIIYIKKLLSKYIKANLIFHFIDIEFYLQCFKIHHSHIVQKL